jgi:hypothetical protein
MKITSKGLHICEQRPDQSFPTKILTLNPDAFMFPAEVAKEVAEVLNKHYYGNKYV